MINKLAGPTSHDIVDAVRRVIRHTHPRPSGDPSQEGTSNSPPTEGRRGGLRVGHAGTLDPFAEGLLIVGVGREATRRLDEFKLLPKTYQTTLRLGAITDTHDRTGRLVMSNVKIQMSRLDIEKILKQFEGEIEQVPPMYSAKKIGGKKLYELARKGQTIERKPAKVTIYSIQLTDYQLPTIKLTTVCSPGTYIRALARDIGEKLGCGAYCEELMRTQIGSYSLNNAATLNQLTSENWQSHLLPLELPTEKLKNAILVFGTFDLLHPGHKDFFRQAKMLGNHLIAGVGRDKVVEKLKGKAPRQSEEARLAAVQTCGLVDDALLLPENPEERFAWIQKQAPDVIALGYDQTAFTENLERELEKHSINCRVVRLRPFKPEIYKSSKI